MSSKYAIINANGRQFTVREGDKIQVDFINKEIGTSLTFNDVLFLKSDSSVKVGSPTIQGASVTATLESQFRADKILVFKYLNKNKAKKLNGHRQPYTMLTINSING